MKKKKDIVYYAISIICFTFLAYLVAGGIIRKRSLDKNAEYTKAIVIDHFYTVRYTDYFSYKFFIDNKEYQGSGRHYPASDTLSVGDSIVVVYDRTNPDINKPERNYKKDNIKPSCRNFILTCNV